jgi:hypothetical protein
MAGEGIVSHGVGDDCWCGIDHRYMDFDDDGNPYDIRDLEDDDEELS